MSLDEIRAKIDSLDRQIVALLNERYKHVIEVGHYKKGVSSAFYVPEREKAVFEKLEGINEGPMTNTTLRAIYREIMSGALSLEYPMSVGYLGPEATFTHLAAISKFGHSVGYVAKASISDIFSDLENSRIDYGCVPIENSTEGAVNYTLDMFVDSSAKICAEINMKVHQCLLSRFPMKSVRKIYSHSQSLSQCRGWLGEYMRGVEVQEVSSNTKAAELAAAEDFTAAIAGSLASEIYGLDILAKNIEDNPNNTTRFLVISKQEPKPTGNDKTSICFAIKDRVGALYDCLLPFKNENITLTMIESRPSKRRNWEYFFFIDMLGHHEDEKLQKALAQLEPLTQSFRVLGSYPRGIDAQD